MINKLTDKKIKSWINENKEYIVEQWMNLVRIPSVKSEAQENAPFGVYCAKALDESAALFSKVDGVRADVYAADGYALAEYGKGNKTIGLYTHSDVVPAGEGWLYTKPFEPVVIEGSLVGRGSEDNKAGIMASLCLVKFLSDNDIETESKIQVFLGSDEECGMGDLKAYLKKHKIPEISFVPDADFPCSVGEKGIYHFWVKSKNTFEDIVDFCGGEAANIVLDKVNVKIRYNEKLFNEITTLTKDDKKFTAECDADYIYITSTGVSKHASIPDGSLNAALIMLQMLSECTTLSPADRSITKEAALLISDNYGKGIGVTNEDPLFGKMTSVNGICKIENHKLCMSFDVRYGDTLKAAVLESEAESFINSHGFEVYNKDNSPGFSIDKNSTVPDKLEEIYNEITGENLKRVVMSGGTYARRLNNAFSVGTHIITADRKDSVFKMPDGHGGMHQRDEKIDITAFFEAVRVLIHYVLESDKIINS